MTDASNPEIVVYTQPGCAPCAAVKEFLASYSVSFVEKDIRADPSALTELRELGAAATPVVRIGDDVVAGFDPGRLAELLAPPS